MTILERLNEIEKELAKLYTERERLRWEVPCTQGQCHLCGCLFWSNTNEIFTCGDCK